MELPNLLIYKLIWLFQMTSPETIAIRIEDKLASLNMQVAKLEERVYENHADAIEDTKLELKELGKKLTIVIILMVINSFVSGAGNWEKILSIIRG